MSYRERMSRAQREMEKRGIDLLFLTPSTNLRYLTGFNGHMMERLSCCVIGRDFARLVAPAFELGGVGPEIRELLDCVGWTDGSSPFDLIASLLPGTIRSAAIGRYTPVWALFGLQKILPNAAWIEADAILESMREVKDEDEYRCLKRVQEKSCQAMLRLLEHGIRGLTERGAAELLVRYLADNGLTDSFPPIIASGPNSAFPHHQPGSRVIEEGDAVIFDFGGTEAEFGYHADTTRTYVVGKAPEGFAEIHDIVLRANQAAFEAAKPGVPCEAVDQAAREVITRAGYGEYFTHRLGHGLGLDIHENPYITAGNTQAVQAGNCFSDEPGIYIPGKFGIRIEDALFIHNDGAERLTPLDHQVTVVR